MCLGTRASDRRRVDHERLSEASSSHSFWQNPTLPSRAWRLTCAVIGGWFRRTPAESPKPHCASWRPLAGPLGPLLGVQFCIRHSWRFLFVGANWQNRMPAVHRGIAGPLTGIGAVCREFYSTHHARNQLRWVDENWRYSYAHGSAWGPAARHSGHKTVLILPRSPPVTLPPPPLEVQVADAALAGHNAWMLTSSAAGAVHDRARPGDVLRRPGPQEERARRDDAVHFLDGPDDGDLGDCMAIRWPSAEPEQTTRTSAMATICS